MQNIFSSFFRNRSQTEEVEEASVCVLLVSSIPVLSERQGGLSNIRRSGASLVSSVANLLSDIRILLDLSGLQVLSLYT